MPAYAVEWLRTPMEPGHLAELIESGGFTLTRYTHSTTGATTTWMAIPQKIEFLR